MITQKEYTAIAVDIVSGAKKLLDLGDREGLLDHSTMRLTIEARKALVPRLIAAGLDQTATAKHLGTSKDTVKRDLGKLAPSDAPGARRERQKKPKDQLKQGGDARRERANDLSDDEFAVRVVKFNAEGLCTAADDLEKQVNGLKVSGATLVECAKAVHPVTQRWAELEASFQQGVN